VNSQQVFQQTLRHDNFIVRDHRVHGVRTLPGVALLDMVYRLAVRYLGADAVVELRRVIFKQPIVTSEKFDREIAVTFLPVDGHCQVSIASYRTRKGQRLDDACTENMECALHAARGDMSVQALDVDSFIRGAEYHVDMDEVYGLARRANIEHYAFMKTLGTVYVKGPRELMRLRLGDEAEKFRDKFHAHPALLDGSTFAGQSIRVRHPTCDQDNTPYIPLTINRFRLYRPLPREIFTYSDNEAYWSRTGGPNPDVNVTDLAVFDGSGELLAEFDKVSMKRIRSAQAIRSLIAEAQGPASAPARPNREDVSPRDAGEPAMPAGLVQADRTDGPAVRSSLVAFMRENIAATLQRSPDGVSTTDNFYDLGMESSQLLQLTRQVETAIGKELYPTLLFEYSSIDRLADHLAVEYGATISLPLNPKGASLTPPRPELTVPPTAAAENGRSVLVFAPCQVEQKVLETQERPHLPVHVVCVADELGGSWYPTLAAVLRSSPSVADVMMIHPVGAGVADRAEDLIARLVRHIKELVSREVSGELVLQLVASAESGRSWSAPCAGCLKTLSLEHPRIRNQVCLIDDLMGQSPNTIAPVLLREAAAARKGTATVIYSQSLARRSISTLREIEYNSAESVYPLRDGDTYVIAGGLGGLGMIVADHLAVRSRPRLALLGRSALDEKRKGQIEHLVRRGAEIVHFRIDLTDLRSVENAFARIRQKMSPVVGIVHSAGVIKDQVIGRKHIDDVQRVIGAKMTGLWNLDQVSKDDPLDFFLLFSSLSAIIGNFGQVDYAAANSFMDEFAFYRRSLESKGARHGRTVSINWPLWEQGGMVIDGGVERLLYQSSGLSPLPAAKGMEIMEWALSRGETQVAVTYGTAGKIRAQIAANEMVATLGEGDASKPAPRPVPIATGKEDRQCRSNAIAIIGLAGRYPLAPDVDAFYRNLRAGRNCISDIPLERWRGYDFGYDLNQYYRYGGFLEQIDQFDPLLFGIPPVRAQFLDPQARLFLETAWHACEDAGFYHDRKSQNSRASSEASVGVFVGAFWSHYELFGAEKTVRGVPTSMGVSLSSIANTTSYCMNFHGPSVALDTMCSSALTAIHMACKSLQGGECDYAVAGGVNLVCHPHKFIFLQENHFLSSHGQCRSFGAGGDGYVPGEGVGAVLLTTLDRAIKMRYPIRAVITGSAVNHSGKTAGATVPNPVAQSEVIAAALTAAAVDPRTLGYVEAHGTGTSLGDPIEIDGLTKAFGRWTNEKQFCAIGSSKSNIGHLEAAAGIAGLTKLVLQLEHGEIFPSLHAETLNPLIPFTSSPFHVATQLRPWERTGASPRRALISAFGASGSNASLVVEEHIADDREERVNADRAGKVACIVLSARDPERLKELARNLAASVRRGTFAEAQLLDVAYTLQVGREPMDRRVAFAAASLGELEQKLAAFADNAAAMRGLYQGKASRRESARPSVIADAEGVERGGDDGYAGVLRRWVEGENIDWDRLYGVRKPKRVHLPGYVFAKQRCWVPDAVGSPAEPRLGPAAAVLEEARPLPPAQTGASVLALRPSKRLTELADVRVEGPRQRVIGKVSLVPLQGSVGAREAPTCSVKPAMPEQESLAAIEQSLASGLAKALFIEPGEIDLDAPFTDLGLDSIIAAQWMKAVNTEFARSFKATILYEYPTIRRLAGLLAELPQGASTISGPSTASVARAAADPQVAADPPVSMSSIAVGAGEVADFLRQSLASVLFLEPDEIDDGEIFTEYGLDSIIAVQWIKAVNAKYGVGVKAQELYERPNLSALAQHLHGLMASAPSRLELSDPALPEAKTAGPGGIGVDAARRARDGEPLTLSDKLAHALAECREADVSLIEVSPGHRLEVIAAGRGSPVVLLPPMGTLATAWMHQIRPLSGNYRVIVFHYPGHGNSPFIPDGATFGKIAVSIRNALKSLGIDEKIHLVGWSMGALISQVMALKSPEEVKTLTLVGAPAYVEREEALDTTISVLDNLMKDFAENAPVSARDAHESRFEFIRTSSLQPEVSMRYLEETLAFKFARAAEISLPTLVVFGSRDHVIGPEHGVALAGMIRGSRHHECDQGGHYVPFQNHTWFNEKLLGFFRDVERPPNSVIPELERAQPA
jgi:polyketide synthase PksJ